MSLLQLKSKWDKKQRKNKENQKKRREIKNMINYSTKTCVKQKETIIQNESMAMKANECLVWMSEGEVSYFDAPKQKHSLDADL